MCSVFLRHLGFVKKGHSKQRLNTGGYPNFDAFSHPARVRSFRTAGMTGCQPKVICFVLLLLTDWIPG